jgi:hypothetical protein
MSYLVVLAIAGFALAWTRLNRVLTHDIFSPFNVLLFSWVVPLCMVGLNSSMYQRPWSWAVYLALLWTTACLAGISILAGTLVSHAWSSPHRTRLFVQDLQVFSRPTTKGVLLVAFAVAFGAMVYSEFVTNPHGVPLFSVIRGDGTTLGLAHRWGKDTRWMIVAPLLFVLSPMLLATSRLSRRGLQRWLFLCLAFAYPLAGLLKLSRSDLFIGVLNLIVFEYYFRQAARSGRGTGPWRVHRYILLAGVGFAAFSLTLMLRLGGERAFDLYADAVGFKPQGGNILVGTFVQLYGYAALPFENLARILMDYRGGTNLGISSLRPLLSITGNGRLADAIQEKAQIPEPISQAAGSSTFLGMIFVEMGWVGVGLVPLAYALLVNGAYVLFRRRPGTTSLFLYINWVYPWAWLFFNNAFSALTFYLNALFVIGLFVLLEVTGARRRWRVAAPSPHNGAGSLATSRGKVAE